MRRTTKLLGLTFAGSLLLGCQDLNVPNPNEPDRDRATSQPAAVEALVASSFAVWWDVVHGNEPAWAISTMADEFTGAFLD